MQRQGVTPGIPDVFIAIPSKGLHGLFIEFKRPKGKVTKSQEEMHDKLKAIGYCVLVCYGWEEAKNEVMSYLT